MSRPRRAWFIGALCFVCGCKQLGNPPQFATGPTQWTGEQGHLVTTTRSFRNEKTIRRLVSEGLGELDHADASIGPYPSSRWSHAGSAKNGAARSSSSRPSSWRAAPRSRADGRRLHRRVIGGQRSRYPNLRVARLPPWRHEPRLGLSHVGELLERPSLITEQVDRFEKAMS